MKTFLWYKKKILLSVKRKIAGIIIIPLIYFFLYWWLKVDSNIVIFFSGISISLIYTYTLFTMGDLTRVNCFIAAGEKPKNIWLANLFFVTFIGLIMCLIFQVAAGIFFFKDLKKCAEFCVITLCEVPFVTFLVGLSTLHFRKYSRTESLIASVFALLNAAAFFLPMLGLITSLKLKLDLRLSVILGIIGLIGTIFLMIYMNFSDNEALVMNATKEISSYDKSMLGLDEE